jgi:hypothetical protein
MESSVSRRSAQSSEPNFGILLRAKSACCSNNKKPCVIILIIGEIGYAIVEIIIICS